MKALPIVLAWLLQVGVAQQPIELTLDVLGIPAPPTRPEILTGTSSPGVVAGEPGCGCVGGTSGGPEVPSLTATLVEITPETFSVGDAIVFELLVEHVGKKPIPIAISRDPYLAQSCRPVRGSVRTSFALLSRDSHDVIAVSPGLFGSQAVAGTTMMLQPGERLRVRVPAEVVAVDRARPREEDPQALQVGAVFQSAWDSCSNVYQRSRATLPVFVSLLRR